MPGVQSRRFAWTMNNYTEADVKILSKDVLPPGATYLAFAREVAPSTGTMHLQGYLEILKKKTLTDCNP